MNKVLDLYVDGACRGNPGEAAIGVLAIQNHKTKSRISLSIGEATNNIAEYTALIYGLQEALILKADYVRVSTDSELLFNQVMGNYKVKNATLKILHQQICHLLKGFKGFEINHIPREENKEADKLAAQAIKQKQAKMVAPLFNFGEESPSSVG